MKLINFTHADPTQKGSRDTAIIEFLQVGSKLPRQERYIVYENSKGQYCTVQRKRVYLKEIYFPGGARPR